MIDDKLIHLYIMYRIVLILFLNNTITQYY